MSDRPTCGNDRENCVTLEGYCTTHGNFEIEKGEVVELTPPFGDAALPHWHPLRHQDAFIADWDKMIGTIADFAARYNLPVPEIIIHPEIHMTMNAVARQRILGTLIYRGVKVRTGIFESATVLRER